MRTRTVGVVYVSYFVGAVVGQFLGGQAGAALSLLAVAQYVVLVAMLYALFRPVDDRIAIIALSLGIVGCAIQGVASMFAFQPADMELYAAAARIALPFFGGFLVAMGALVVKSHAVPRAIGALLAVAGVGWMTFAYPPLSGVVGPVVFVVGIVAEVSFMLWLLVFGVPTRVRAA